MDFRFYDTEPHPPTYVFCLPDLRPNQSEDFLVGSRELARLLHSKNDVAGAKDVIEQAVNKFPESAHTGGDKSRLFKANETVTF